MKLISRLLILAIVPMMLFVACGQETTQTTSSATPLAPPSDAEQAARQAQVAANDLRQTVNRLDQENQLLIRELLAMQQRANEQGALLRELNQHASRLEMAAASRASAPEDGSGAVAQPVRAEQQTASSFSSFLLFIVFLIVALIVIYFIYRALKPRPFEDDEDDDFSSFDDDFGFDDEEDEESDDDLKKDSEDK